MKEHPILMSTPMVKAILEGRKTQTRRVAKDFLGLSELPEDWGYYGYLRYGQVGDRLWVRETFCDDCPSAREDENGVCYKANRENQPASDFCTKWKPSIFMPRWASRITLEITDIKVQRLWEITEADALREGILPEKDSFNNPPSLKFALLWDKINGKKYPWEDNLLVWVISFKKITQ